MIELDVEPRRKVVASATADHAHYLVLGDFGAQSTRTFAVDRDNLDEILKSMDVKLAGTTMREMEDFHPDRLYERFDLFSDLREKAPEPPAARPKASPRPDLGEILRTTSLLEQIAAGGGDPLDQYIRELARAHTESPAPANPQKHAVQSERLRALLHHARFQTVEAAWRGLDFVVRRMEDESARIHITQFRKDELAADLLNASDLKATRAYTLFHSREWRGIFGLYSFGAAANDIELLGRIALLAASARAPFIAEGSADMGEHWEELRAIPEAANLGLALPRLLLRLPYGPHTSPIDAFDFEEMPGPPEHARYLWGSPAWACLAVQTCGDELDLCNLPLHSYQEEDGEWKTTPCAEICMTDTQVDALIELGLMPLVSFRDADQVRLAGLRAINGKSLPNT